jgi:hypothetical protein
MRMIKDKASCYCCMFNKDNLNNNKIVNIKIISTCLWECPKCESTSIMVLVPWVHGGNCEDDQNAQKEQKVSALGRG